MEKETPMIKLFEMISMLHDKGYQKLRVMTYYSPSGCYFRCEISCKDNFDKKTGFIIETKNQDEVYHYSSADEFCFFKDNVDMKKATIEELSEKFKILYPSIIEKAKGRDNEYFLWFKDLLKIVKNDVFPYAFADYDYDIYTAEKLKLTDGTTINFPPPGNYEKK